MQEIIQLTKSEKIHLGTKEITRRIREELKQFKGCKFSVTHEHYSMGSSIIVALMESDFKVIREMNEISELALMNIGSGYTKENIKEMQRERYHQLNQYQLIGEFNPNAWSNGIFLTEEGFKLLKKVVEIANQYNYDESDIQSDYFNTNFYFHLNLGKWNNPFKEIDVSEI